jgi:hypothetical protein
MSFAADRLRPRLIAESRMKRTIAVALLGLAAGFALIGSTGAGDDETKLAAKLRHHEQIGPPIACVSLAMLRSNTLVGSTAIVFQGRNFNTLWVNRPEGGCPVLRMGRALQTETGGSRLCRGDLVTVWDPVSGVDYGTCPLGDFTAYKRARR